MFNVKIEGLDEIQDTLNGMLDGLDPIVLNHYCDLIKKDARITCGIKDDEILLKAYKDDANDNIKIEFNINDKLKVACFRKVLLNIISSLPLTSRSLFQALLDRLDGDTS